jgi:hypothetical protein
VRNLRSSRTQGGFNATYLREECASELAAMLDFSTCLIGTGRHAALSVRALNARMKYQPPNSRRSQEFGVGALGVPD